MDRSSGIHRPIPKTAGMVRATKHSAIQTLVVATALAVLVVVLALSPSAHAAEPHVCLNKVEQRAAISHGQAVTLSAAIRSARAYIGDRLIRVAKPHRLLDPAAGPLIAVRLSVLTRKTLGGLETDLDGRALRADGQPLPGLYAAGEVAGFGGGGMHGYRALEGTFLGGCLFSGRAAGRGAAADIA